MKIKDFVCYFNLPKQLKAKHNSHGEEKAHSLPPYAIQPSLIVDEYPACPSNWMHGSSISSSYFVEVHPDRGMWLDFNENFDNEHDVAVVLSIQGINPITGQKMVGDNPLRLEQYKNKCPIHNVDFQQDRYCPSCGFKWPAQNYIATTGTPNGRLWIDGFRAEDGKIRQYVFTEEEMKGVASQLIGDERVFAIGVAFYKSKKKKEVTNYSPSIFAQSLGSFSSFSPMHTPQQWGTTSKGLNYRSLYGTSVSCSVSPDADGSDMLCCDSLECFDAKDILPDNSILRSQEVKEVVPVKKLEIGAGALIEQDIYDDPKEIDYWEEKPSGMIYINYCDSETMQKIIASGKRVDKKNGFMSGINVSC